MLMLRPIERVLAVEGTYIARVITTRLLSWNSAEFSGQSEACSFGKALREMIINLIKADRRDLAKVMISPVLVQMK